MAGRYVPDAGDVVRLQFNPQAGHGQAGHRPALVLSPAAYNGKTGLMLCCPMTTHVKGYPFEVRVASGREGVALADQVKSLDWKVRKAKRKARASTEELAEARAKAMALIAGAA